MKCDERNSCLSARYRNDWLNCERRLPKKKRHDTGGAAEMIGMATLGGGRSMGLPVSRTHARVGRLGSAGCERTGAATLPLFGLAPHDPTPLTWMLASAGWPLVKYPKGGKNEGRVGYKFFEPHHPATPSGPVLIA